MITSFKNFAHRLLNNIMIRRFLIVLILLNFFAFVFESDQKIAQSCALFFRWFEYFTVAVFTIELLLRLFLIKSPHDLLNIYILIDFLSVFPFYISLMTVNTTALRVFQLMRLLRLAKLARLSNAMDNICCVFARRKYELSIMVLFFFVFMFLFAILIYYAERENGHFAFSSIISSCWWSVVTMTTVGFGDCYPVTHLGRLIGAIACCFGVCFHGVMIGLMSSAIFEIIHNAERRRLAYKKAVKLLQKRIKDQKDA